MSYKGIYKRLLVYGDSFCASGGLNQHRTWTADSWCDLLALRLNIPCYVYGVGGTGPLEMIHTLHSHCAAGEILPTDIVLCSYSDPNRYCLTVDTGAVNRTEPYPVEQHQWLQSVINRAGLECSVERFIHSLQLFQVYLDNTSRHDRIGISTMRALDNIAEELPCPVLFRYSFGNQLAQQRQLNYKFRHAVQLKGDMVDYMSVTDEPRTNHYNQTEAQHVSKLFYDDIVAHLG